MKNRKLIFLDINNVVYKNNEVNKQAMEALEILVKETKAFIVIISSWRLEMNLSELKNLFPANIKKQIMSVTPIINLFVETEKKYIKGLEVKSKQIPCQLTRKSQRGLEIKLWLQSNKDKLGCKISKFKSYVILDDSNHGIMLDQNAFYYRINKETGLTLLDSNNLIEILNT